VVLAGVGGVDCGVGGGGGVGGVGVLSVVEERKTLWKVYIYIHNDK